LKIDFDNAFISRESETISDREIKNIMNFYRIWRDVQLQQGPEYQVSREWLPIFSQYLNTTVNAFLNDDLKFVKNAFNNFFRHPISTGLHGLHFQMTEVYMNPHRTPTDEEINSFVESSLLSLQTFLLSCPSTGLEKLARPPVGNPYGFNVNGVEIYPCATYHLAFAQKINLLVKKFANPKVLEIGGGFGGLAYYLLKENPDVKVLLCDLPENAALQAFYLKSMFPEKKVMLYGEASIYDDFDILICPNYAIEELGHNSIHLTFNSYSLAEMSRESVDHYVKLICQASSNYFFHLNHVYWEISSDTFPIDFEKFELLYRNPTLWGKDPTAYQLDQHEYLYVARNPKPCL